MVTIRDVIVLALEYGSVPICFFKPMYGIVAWIVVGFVNPQFFAWGVARASEPALLVAIPTILGFLIFSRTFSALRGREPALLIVLWGWFTITTLNSNQEPLFLAKSAAAWYRWGMVSKIMLMALVTIAASNNWKRLRWVVLSIAGSFGFLVLKNLPQMILSDGASRVYGPDYSMIADNNDFALALNMALPIFFYVAKTEQSRTMRRIMTGLFLLTIPTVLFTYSRGGLLGIIAVLGSMLVLSRHRIALIPIVFFGILFGVFLTPEAWRDRMDLAQDDKLYDASALSRLNAWSYSWHLASDYPIMGGGFEDFTPELFARYAPDGSDVHGPHSIYFGVLAEHGFTGLLFYLTLVGSCFASLHRIANTAGAMGTPHIATYANMLKVSLVGFLASGAFLGRAYFDFFFSIVACVAILKYVSRIQWAQSVDPEPEPAWDAITVSGPGRYNKVVTA